MQTAVKSHSARSQDWPPKPYKGLNFYESKDAPLFCERDKEIEACGLLAVSSATKLLLLHGRTGTGKSSFLRAGLIPAVFLGKRNFYLLTEAKTDEPCLVRSTADPLASIADTLVLQLRDESRFITLSEEVRRKALDQLGAGPEARGLVRAKSLRNALELITSELGGTLVLIIDQAEEVFTLSPRGEDEPRTAYFQFLEGLCFDRFDIKIMGLRDFVWVNRAA